tara:strand:- start:23201 stop:24199 length:999 start_codon:yes stop_codon:yes gene_type:complete
MKVSREESAMFGVKICRYEGNLVSLDCDQLERDILKFNPDLCRIKVLGNDIELFEKLNSLNYYYDLYNLSYYNSLELNKLGDVERNPNLHIREVVNPIDDEDFNFVLSNLLASRSWVEYDSFLSKNILSEDKKRSASFDFYSSFSKQNDGNSYTGLMYKNDKAIGMFMGLFKGEVFFGNLFGLIDEYRGQGLSKYFYGFMYEICHERGINYFENEVNIFNFSSQQSALSQNFMPTKIYYNITIYPFSNFNSGEYVKIPVKDFQGLFTYLSQEYKNYAVSIVKRKVYFVGLSYVGGLILERKIRSAHIFLVVHFIKNGQIGESVYIEMKEIRQ